MPSRPYWRAAVRTLCSLSYVLLCAIVLFRQALSPTSPSKPGPPSNRTKSTIENLYLALKAYL